MEHLHAYMFLHLYVIIVLFEVNFFSIPTLSSSKNFGTPHLTRTNKPVNKPPIGSIYFDEIISNKSMNECPNKIEKSYDDLNYIDENITI